MFLYKILRQITVMNLWVGFDKNDYYKKRVALIQTQIGIFYINWEAKKESQKYLLSVLDFAKSCLVGLLL